MNRELKLDLGLSDKLAAWLQRLDQVVWLDGFYRGVTTAAVVMLLVLVVLLWIRKP